MRSTLPTFNEVWQRKFRSSVLKQLQDFPAETKFLIGCSGGMDSMLLLHLMFFLCPKKIRAIYVDHQLQSSSGQWGQFVKQECQKLKIPCIVQMVKVENGNLEQQARESRYQAYLEHLHSDEVLVLAHHQQDQAETLMLRLLSGAGVNGLSAMKPLDVRDELRIWRPLLDISREQIEQWAAEFQIQHIDDPTNLDTHYDRAWARQTLWPVLTERFPKMQSALARTSDLMQDAQHILNEVLEFDLERCVAKDVLNLQEFKKLSNARQRQLLSAWMKRNAQYRPSLDMVHRLQHEVIDAKADANAAVHWNGYYYVRYQDRVHRLSKAMYLANLQNIAIEQQLHAEMGQTIRLPSGQFLVQAQDFGLSKFLLKKPLKLTLRRGGEKLHLHGRVGSWPLKKAIQAAQIFPWLRHTIQILSIDDVMLGVFTPKGFWLAESPYCEANGWQPIFISSISDLNDEH